MALYKLLRQEEQLMYGLEPVMWKLYTEAAAKLENTYLKCQVPCSNVMLFNFRINYLKIGKAKVFI
jgi:hypothetical protein